MFLIYWISIHVMNKDINETVKRIAKLNDAFRASIQKPISEQRLGQVFCTASIMALSDYDIASIVEKVRLFDTFDESNDPYAEHDFGSFTYKDNKIYWKIDYEDPCLEYQPKYTSEQNEPNRILTIMLSQDW